MRSALWNMVWIPDESPGFFPAKPGLHSLHQCRLTAWCWLGLQNQDFFLKWVPGTGSAAAFPACLNGLSLSHCCLGIQLNKVLKSVFFQGLIILYHGTKGWMRLEETSGCHFWMSPGPAPWLKQRYLEPPAQSQIQTPFRHFQGWRYWQGLGIMGNFFMLGWGDTHLTQQEYLSKHSV